MNAETVNFAVDHGSPTHPKVLNAIVEANRSGYEPSYGEDKYTQKAQEVFKGVFGKDAETFFVTTGTAANLLTLSHITPRWAGIICSNQAHITTDEGIGPTAYGLRLIEINTMSNNAKLTVPAIESEIKNMRGLNSATQPKTISLTQATERGTVYTVEEIDEIVKYAHNKGMLVHLDLARGFNAQYFLKKSLYDFTTGIGVDAVSLGAAKTGGLGSGEAVVFLKPGLSEGFKYFQKQTGHCPSKMRNWSAQWPALFKDDLALGLAGQANKMIQKLLNNIKSKHFSTLHPVQADSIWTVLPPSVTENLQKNYEFHADWTKTPKNTARIMCSYDTNARDVNKFAQQLTEYLDSFVK